MRKIALFDGAQSILILILGSILCWSSIGLGAPAPISESDCQKPLFSDKASLMTATKSVFGSESSLLNKLLTNYDFYAKTIGDRYVICFDPALFTKAGNEKFAALPSMSITAKTGKPLVIYGLTWAKDTTSGSLLSIGGSGSGAEVLLQNVKLTSNNTALSFTGSGHGISNSTITGTGTNATGINAVADNVTISNTTVENTKIGIALNGKQNAIGPGTVVKQSSTTAGTIGIELNGTTSSIQNTTLSGPWSTLISGDSIGIKLAGSGHNILNSKIEQYTTAVHADGTDSSITENYLDGAQYDVFLSAAVKKVFVQKNIFAQELPQCPEGKSEVSCHVYLESGANSGIAQPSVDETKGDLFKRGAKNAQGVEFIDRLYDFRADPTPIQHYILVDKDPAKGLPRRWQPLSDEVTLQDSKLVMDEIKTDISQLGATFISNPLLPEIAIRPDAAVLKDVMISPKDYLLLQLNDEQKGSTAFSDTVFLGSVAYVITTPSGGVVLIASGGDETGGGGSPIGGTEPSPSPGSDDKDDKAKDKGNQMAGGDGAAVIVGGGAGAEGAPLSGLGAGVKGGCSLILPR